ncbi:MAG: [Fe-Fe] hydrogenase large subunit C-terminal domain-containing protein [Pleomorphochaeta sp.]|jgi:iron only hydrogenase large subunit-like protein
MIPPIFTELTQCRDCYKCVRACPTKAIQVKEGNAVVIHDRCTYCGICVDVCPANAKKVRKDLARVQMFVKGNRKIFCSIAPSHSSEFVDREAALLIALKKLGFDYISETAIGASLVSASIDECRKRKIDTSWISTACPSIVQLVKKYYSTLEKQLAPIPSPLQLHCAYLREKYGSDIGIVFIGPCIAKKWEADEWPGYPNFALTFEELKQWFEEEGINLDFINKQLIANNGDYPEYVPAKAAKTSAYSVEGGMIASFEGGDNFFQDNSIAISGNLAVKATLDNLVNCENNQFLELLSCEGGCINGPATNKLVALSNKKAITTGYTRERLVQQDLFIPPKDFIDKVIDEGYKILKVEKTTKINQHYDREIYTEKQIKKALHELGKIQPADELNCGGCGYSTCRDMAIAYLDGMAEIEMCVTKMRKEAQNKMDVLLRTIPMGVVIVDEKLKIVDCNAKFLELFSEVDYEVDNAALEIIKGLSISKFIPFEDVFEEQFKRVLSKQVRLKVGNLFLKITFFSINKHNMVGALFDDITNPTVRRETVVKKAEAVIQKSLETVQQIASLLGENAADTEITLNSLIEAFDVPSEDKKKKN